jgi:uncharacterized protein (TIGR00730 family)
MMQQIDRKNWNPLSQSPEAVKMARKVADTAQTRAEAYRLAFTDDEFMVRRELRPVRLQLELLKPDLFLEEMGIDSTIVMFGGARIPAPDQEAWAAENAHQAARLKANSIYYSEAQKFASLVSTYSKTTDYREFVICTGGGPGVMEAGNRGAHDVGAPSIGLNIVLPHEQAPNPYITPELCFNFHYFALRKMHFLMRAKAITAFPGGFGTMDELFESLTLMQTGRMEKMPIILFGTEFWKTAFNLEFLANEGFISLSDVDLVHYVDTADQAWDMIKSFYAL